MFDGNGGMAGMAGRAQTLMGRAEQVLDLILEALDTRVEQIAITDKSSDPGLQKDFPTPGAQRWILHRTGTGQTLAMPAAELIDVLASNVNRLGGTIVNSGKNPVQLFLCEANAKNEATASIWLGADGGSWDFRLGNLFWSGSVSAEAPEGVSTVTLVEV